jgi:hypothetical protein
MRSELTAVYLGFEVFHVNTAQLIHLDHNSLHTGHLSCSGVGAMRRLWNEADLHAQYTSDCL